MYIVFFLIWCFIILLIKTVGKISFLFLSISHEIYKLVSDIEHRGKFQSLGWNHLQCSKQLNHTALCGTAVAFIEFKISRNAIVMHDMLHHHDVLMFAKHLWDKRNVPSWCLKWQDCNRGVNKQTSHMAISNRTISSCRS